MDYESLLCKGEFFYPEIQRRVQSVVCIFPRSRGESCLLSSVGNRPFSVYFLFSSIRYDSPLKVRDLVKSSLLS